MEAAMTERPGGAELIVTGEFNIDLEVTGAWVQEKNNALEIATAGIEDIVGHLLPQQRTWFKDLRKWVVVSQGRVVWSWMDYTLGS